MDMSSGVIENEGKNVICVKGEGESLMKRSRRV